MMARKRAPGLSNPQKKILEVLDGFQKKFGYPPSIRDIQKQTGISSTSMVNYYLEQLEEMGYIERDDRVSRGMRLVKPFQELGQAMGELLRIPILGRIVAGSPVPVPSSDFSYFDADSMVDVAVSSLPARERGNDLFALEVQGDSMIDAMVYDGDIVILRPVQNTNNGDMVAVWLSDRDETTLKYFYQDQQTGKIRLQPANPTMQPILVDDPSIVQIQGKVVMVIRQVKGLVA